MRPQSTDLPKISVIMSVYNDEDYLRDSVESVLAQTEPRFEFLIVNDGSSDASPQILDEYAAKDSRISVFHRTNHGLIASLNFLLSKAKAPLIARMDGDDMCRPTRFAVQLAAMEKRPDIAVMGANTDELDQHGNLLPCYDFHPEDPAEIRAQLARGAAMCHPAVMMRRDIITALGGYRKAYRHCEDYDLWLRVSERHDLSNVLDRLLLYRRSPNQVSEKHAFVQACNAVYARYAHQQRLAGKPDPFDGLDELPTLDMLDAYIGERGVSARIRAQIIESVKYSRRACAGPGLVMMRAHLREGGGHHGYWKTALRMVKMRLLPQALTLAATLVVTQLLHRQDTAV